MPSLQPITGSVKGTSGNTVPIATSTPTQPQPQSPQGKSPDKVAKHGRNLAASEPGNKGMTIDNAAPGGQTIDRTHPVTSPGTPPSSHKIVPNPSSKTKYKQQSVISSPFDIGKKRKAAGGNLQAETFNRQKHSSRGGDQMGSLKSPPELLVSGQQQLINGEPTKISSPGANGSSQSSGECTQESQDSLKPAAKKIKVEYTNDDAEFNEAIKLSLQQGECRQLKEDEELQRGIALSAMESRRSCSKITADATSVIDQSSGREVIELLDDDSDNPIETKDVDSELERVLKLSLETADEDKARRTFCNSPLYNNLSRSDFQRCFDDWFNRQGGIDKIEKGTIVQEGNNWNDFRKGVSKDDMRNQERAQYGRLSIPALYQILDSLTGVNRSCGLSPEAVGKIDLFMDIGMGIGVQVLQAAFVYGFPSRGIEIMRNRFMMANELLEAFKEEFRKDPPDASKVEMLQKDFARAFPDGVPQKNGQPDFELRSFLLCLDRSDTQQKGLVVFVNNAEDVFDARSNDNAATRSLDSFLAELFGNVKVGVRFVTLTSLTKNLERGGWWREDVLELEAGCVSWSEKSQKSYVLTKLKDMWTCPDCYQSTNAVDDSGRLSVDCVFCEKMPLRTTKRRGAGVNKKYYAE